MRPEPWGEAFDALGIDGATVVVPTPSGRPFSQALARELATRERLVFAVRALRGHRPAGARPRRDPGRGRRGVARRLRAQRRRGGRARHHRGGGPAAARASWATPSRWPRSRTRTACWSTPSTPGRRRGAASTSRPCCCPATTPRSRAGAPSRPGGVRRSGGRTCCTPASRPASGEPVPGQPRRRRGDAHPAAGLLGPGGARQRHASPTSRRCTSRSTTCWPGCETWSTWVVRAEGRLVGAVRGRLGRRTAWDIGRIMVAPDLQGRGLGRLLLAHIESVAAARGDVVRAVHRCPQRRQHPDVPARPATGSRPTSSRRPGR